MAKPNYAFEKRQKELAKKKKKEEKRQRKSADGEFPAEGANPATDSAHKPATGTETP
jgi:hypothetical protein